ncbi:MAG: XdhC family protein [Pseudomonadota bacterium]
MRHKNRVFGQIKEWQEQGESVVLAVVVATQGSTYSKVGDFIALTASGDYQGLVSGGCVEGDLAMRAARVAASNQSEYAHYDLGGEHDALWGMGAGCDGDIEVLLVAIDDVLAHQLNQVFDRYANGEPSVLMLGADTPPLLVKQNDTDASPTAIAVMTDRRSKTLEIDGTRQISMFIAPTPRVLILGAAPDSHPLCELIHLLGWQVSVADHRPAYIDALPAFVRAVCSPSQEVGEQIDVAGFNVAMVMSHHLDADRHYLSAIAGHRDWAYLGLLGPRHRRDKLLADLDADQRDYLDAVLDGPAGLEIGAREPASIALSIVAKMHAALASVRLV